MSKRTPVKIGTGHNISDKEGRMKRILILTIFALCVSLLVSCRQGPGLKSSTYEDGFVKGEDFNPTSASFEMLPNNIAVTSKGVYFIAAYFLFFADPETMEARPLCSRPNCLHNEEPDPMKIPECDAFVGCTEHGSFITGYHDNLIMTCLNKSNFKVELVQADPDGRNRKTLIPDLDKQMIDCLRVHRGVVYYLRSENDLDGNKELSLNAVSFTGKKLSSDRFYSIAAGNSDGGYSYQILPAGNHVYFDIFISKDQKTGERDMALLEFDIRTGKVSEIFTGEQYYSLSGVRNGKLILYKEMVYYEYDTETGEIREEKGMNAFSEDHQGWNCHADCISEKLTLFSCFDPGSESDYFVKDRYMADLTGKTICTIEGKGWPTGGQIIDEINGRDYMITMTGVAPFSVDAYAVDDLLTGKADRRTLLWADDINNFTRSFVLPGNAFEGMDFQ